MKKSVFLLICISCVFSLSQCNKSGLFDDENHDDGCFIIPLNPVAPFDYSSVAFIARITENSSDWSLCVMDKTGNNMKKIFEKTVGCQKPIRSHSGTRLLFIATTHEYWVDEDNAFRGSSEYGLYIVNTDGTGLTLIDHIDHTEDGNFGSVAWSPDDSQIVYVRTYDNYWEKSYLIFFNISDNTQTILETEINVCSPNFSHDGKQIIYCATSETGHHIYKMDLDGNNNQLIISNASSPKLSPQGNKIAYSSSGKDGSSQIFVADACGHNQKQLTSTVSPRLWPGWPPDGNGDPQWTQDGKKIVYVSSENERAEIFIMNADGNNKTRLTKAETSISFLKYCI